MEDEAFDEFLQTPILGRKKLTKEEQEEEDLEQGNASVRVNVASHQAVTRGNGAARTTSLREASCGGGRSQRLQPQVVWGYCLLQGLADHDMEDLIVAEVRTVDDEEVACFAVFDAHNGSTVAQHLQSHLFSNILNEDSIKSNPSAATRNAYLLTDRTILSSPHTGGSTSVTAMLYNNRITVANLGDSRAILSKSGKAIQLSVDHDPGRPAEKASVEARGGHVTHLPGDQWRVDGQLAIARAFGDAGLKEHMTGEPDVVEVAVEKECEFLVLGSNGLFSMFDNQEVVDRVRGGGGDAVKVAHELVVEARRRLGEDDISCIVVMFQES